MRFALLLALAALPALAADPLPPPSSEWRPLFNGKTLDGWDTWLGAPKGKSGLANAVGLNKDPDGVYTVVEADGKPAIRISGQTFGAITTRDEFENYHLKFEFKWGEKKWPPREKDKRDSGLLYHCVGQHGAQGTYWMRSQELQVQEGDCGDFYPVAGGIADMQGTRTDGKGPVRFAPGGTTYTIPSKATGGRGVKSADGEKKSGEWNAVELYAVGQTSVHVVNGKVNMVLTNSRHVVGGKEVPLTKGKLQFQSEGAEVFYRDIAVRPIEKIPAELLGQ